MSSLKVDNLEELIKLDKLLDKTEQELKKKRDEKVYTQSEKFIEHMKKTTDVYSLITEEVIGSLYVMGFTEHTNLLRKLFKGVQLQINSVLKFSLKYYGNKNKELRRGKANDKDKNSNPHEEVLVLIDKFTELPYCPLKGQQTQEFGMGKSKGGRGAGHAGGSPQNRNASNMRPGHHYDNRNHTNASRNMGDTNQSGMFRHSFAGESSFHSAAPQYQGGYNNRPPYPKSNYHHEENEFDYLYNQEQDQMNREIAELLEGRKNLENIGPSEASSNLRQVLKGLEGVKKKVKALGEGEDNEDDHHHAKPDLEKMTSTIMGAFDKAQKKTAKKAIGYALAKEKEGAVMHEVGTMPDTDMLEAYKRQIRFEVETQLNQKTDEVTILKKKFALLESDRNELHDKYSKVTVEHSRCEQVEKELKMKLLHAEKELKALKEIIEDVKKGKVEKLNLSTEQQNKLKKSIQSPNSVAEVSAELMQKLQESRKEMKILKYQLENNGKKPPVGHFDNDNEDIQLASGRIINPAQMKALKKNNNVTDIGNVQAVEIEEKVMVNGKLVTQKKTVYKQLQKKVITNANGERVEVEEFADVDPSDVKIGSDGKISKINSNNNMNSTKKQVKIVSKDKNGQEVTRWEDAPGDSDQDESDEDNEPPVEKRTTSDGKVQKKVIKKDKNGREVEEWVPSTDPEDEPGVEESVGGMTIKTTESGKAFAKVVTKDKNGNEVVNWVEVTPEQVNVLSGNAEGVTEIKGANGQVLKKVVTVDENGEEKVEWVPTGPIIKSGGNSKKSSVQNTARKQNGTVTLQEEVEEEVVVIDENGNQQIVKKKVIKTRQVKKTIDENGEEVIEEIVIDEATGQKKVVVKKLKDMHNVRLMEPGPVHYDSATEREKVTARGSKKVTKSRDTQTSFAVEELIQTALQSAGISGAALQEINKALAKQGVDLVKFAEDKKKRKSKGEGEEFEYVNIPGVGKKKVFFTKGEDFEEIEYVTKDGKKIKKKIPKGEREDYEMDEQGELVYTGKKLQKFRSTNKKYQGHMTDEEEDMHNRSMESVISADENGKPVKKYRAKDFEPIGKAKKTTIDEYLREQEELESQRPPATKEEAQARAMYKAMLTKAKGDPKLMNLFKTYLKDKGIAIADEDNFIADFDTFNEYVKHFRETHGKCGDNCMHLQRFYARIGYYPIWNNRVPLPMTRPDIANQKARHKVMSMSNSKLPDIKKT